MGVWDGLDESEISRPEILFQSAPDASHNCLVHCIFVIAIFFSFLLCVFFPLRFAALSFMYSMSLIGCCWVCKIYHILCYAEIIKCIQLSNITRGRVLFSAPLQMFIEL